MTQKFTAEEVRDAAQTNEHPIPMRARDMLTAYADALSKPASPMQVDIYPLPDSLYPQSKDWIAADYAGRVEWLHAMYENRKDELDCFLAAQERGDAASPLVEFSVDFMDGWLEGESEEVLRNWKRVRQAATRPATAASPADVPDLVRFAIERCLRSQEALVASIDKANPDDPYASVLVAEDIEYLRAWLAAAPSAPEGDGGAE